MKYYTGVGSRQTPQNICEAMTEAAKNLQQIGLGLRSGAADGADAAFERGVTDPSMKQIFLPWKSFNNHDSHFHEPMDRAYDLAAKHHPNWVHLKESVRRLHARNMHQVLGPDLKDHSLFVICWTPEGLIQGGTAMAIRVAQHHSVQILNLGSLSLDVASRLIMLRLEIEGII